MKKSLFLCVLSSSALGFATLISPARADVEMLTLVQDHAILQSNKPLAIWGRADAGERVTVSFADQTISTVTDEKGAWRVILAPLSVNAAPQILTVTGKNALTFKDILVGEVWLCAGQSNMEFKLSKAKNAKEELAAANYPLVRQYSMRYFLSNTPEIKNLGYWTIASSTTAADFNAVGYFFARELHQKLGVPVAIIDASWGGTSVESWLSGEFVNSKPELGFVAQHWQARLDDYPALKAKYDTDLAIWQQRSDEAKSKGEPFTQLRPLAPPNPDGSPHQDKPSAIYNAKIAPLTPATIRGVLWYQGEGNAERALEYESLFPALINGWRAAFHQPDLPFFWVQLPNYNSRGWTELRVAQSKTLALPATGQAITIDVGEANNIHPLNKQSVGDRLARLALRRVYNRKIADSGPVFSSARFEGGAARIEFTSVEGGLRFEGETLSGFEVAGADRKFVPAVARIEGACVIISASGVPLPIAVRYAWKNAPVANLANSEGLPAAPFRTDSWDEANTSAY